MQTRTNARGSYFITDAAAAMQLEALRDEWDNYDNNDYDSCALCARCIEHTVTEHESVTEENRRHAAREQAALERWARDVYDYARDFDFNGEG